MNRGDYMKNENLDLAVAILKPKQNKLEYLYDNISTFEEAHLLAIDSMNKKDDFAGELVMILPGWNLRMSENDKERVVELIEKYLVDK